MGTIFRSGTVVLGILLIRRLAMGKITRKLQYSIWIILPVTLLVSSHFSIPVTLPVSAANLKNVLIKDWDITQAPFSTFGIICLYLIHEKMTLQGRNWVSKKKTAIFKQAHPRTTALSWQVYGKK